MRIFEAIGFIKYSQFLLVFKSRKIYAALSLLFLCLAESCSHEAISNSGQKKIYTASGANLILISIDTLRADRLGCYGYDPPTSPTIDSLASIGVRFEKVIAESSWTLPSHMSLLTGLYPTSHGVTLENKQLSDTIPTLAQILQANGYRCYGNTGGILLWGKYGFDRGFETYIGRKKPFKITLNAAMKWIKSLKPGERYFLFLHTYDVHCPYDPPRKYSLMFRTRPIEDHIETKGKCGNPHYNNMKLTPGKIRFLSDQYDASIRAADDDLFNFFQFLESSNAFDNTIIAIVSDHGEEFKEHGKIGHERTLYIESLMVPLIIVAPGLEPRVVPNLVGLADVMPTLLEMLKINPPSVQGRSLLPLMLGFEDDWSDRPMFSELDNKIQLRSIVHDSYHLIFNTEQKEKELYDLSNDPKEQIDLKEGMSESAEELEKILLSHFDSLMTAPEEIMIEKLSLEQIEKLRALGYIN